MFSSARSTAWQAFRKLGLTIFLVLVLVTSMLSGHGVHAKAPPTAVATITVEQLPNEALITLQLIRRGGPFPYSKDGVVFGNRERFLPSHPRGYYREYTVKTVGARDRGARRIVCGGKQITSPDACYYSDDHYASFSRIVK